MDCSPGAKTTKAVRPPVVGMDRIKEPASTTVSDVVENSVAGSFLGTTLVKVFEHA
jgi:hypothetical protein